MYQLGNLVKELSDKHGRARESLMPILQGIVEKHNYLTDEAMVEVAKELDISAAEVYGTASFYTFLDTQVRGKYVIRVCKTITCSMKGKGEIIQTLEDMLKIKVGETTSDRQFSLIETNCIGWCHKAPAMLINEMPYTELTPEKVVEIIKGYMQKK
ncbi:MAG TPA: NAD(P)H-dependent oxidoreductase subunit E [Bacteroidales bacterium]|jgi:NADH:ubiquinone oxidoreductase subunit E|nr:NAD(P)H-dependent oxidoreductase subunit E [Bacteroidales bacterium]OQB64915.1 MAG: NADH-quinone oxidoreductase subunit E [Bacteroidetes bacterium ADurb.Bin145]HOU03219.1 NAD(P)H-dependent oxidoreductase subunit E [Bacteroidales bacterium]HQG63698.1 NAD(P)H-dependent oxidoreductase subunit E [Bacteroidales bacterium]HQK66873.1 NAD(P)H-dependent oxidoreductase subunit E [Bacteroidales bacterium]